MLNGGVLILEMVVLLLGHLHKQSTVGATHVDTDPIHYNISFGDALLYISSVTRACSVKSFRPGSFVMRSDINHAEGEQKQEGNNDSQNELLALVLFSQNICKTYTGS